MNINDFVISKNTGMPASGTIIAIFDGGYFYTQVDTRPKDRWTELYPDWTSKSVIFVKLSSPQKPVSFDEFRLSQIGVDENKISKLYEYTVPVVDIVSYPEEDLEVIE